MIEEDDVKAVRLGTAGWNVPRSCKERVGGTGSHLERYAKLLNATEINSSFHKPHRRSTYQKWANATPDDFRFSGKVPKSVTHSPQLALTELDRFIEESAGLGSKLGVLLVQFAPRRIFVESEAELLFSALRDRSSAALACEPRHTSWFSDEVGAWLSERRICRVAADPARAPDADLPGGWPSLRYFRLHGAPRIYHSAYDGAFLRTLKTRLDAASSSGETWCILDNTAAGAALENALDLLHGPWSADLDGGAPAAPAGNGTERSATRYLPYSARRCPS
ncbi:DUF72 domain-containing protein [Bradyrhizobium sp. 44]|uniref:DUF72 domain-containing protein n=1 Tax=Bradyrhizobium sp. 44 TaxID=2782675 RepID=UPI001FF9253B|nr:DUF72 domain-containing protein [Bradyrhizobium sp. 44]MCK1284360.1 DUF72 domain-containing protein [Bradyrhizobium sp. 44]